MATNPLQTIDVVKFLEGDVSQDGSSGWIDLETDGKRTRLKMDNAALGALLYILLPLASKANSRKLGPGNVHTFVIDRLDVIEDDSAPNILILRFCLGRDSEVAFEIPSELVDGLADGIAAYKREGPYSLTPKSTQ
jgi:hypothetical protein